MIVDKLELTSRIIEEAGLKVDLKAAYANWWYPTNSQNVDHMRLTAHGCEALKMITPYWEFVIEFNNTPNDLKKLSFIRTPYHIDRSGCLTIFSKQLATMGKLYESFDRYLEILQNS